MRFIYDRGCALLLIKYNNMKKNYIYLKFKFEKRVVCAAENLKFAKFILFYFRYKFDYLKQHEKLGIKLNSEK
jgi:hypothetical protein